MAILVMPTQVTAMGFLKLVTNMGMYDSLLPLIIPSIASPAVFYFMYSYLQSSLPISLVEAARIDGSGEFKKAGSGIERRKGFFYVGPFRAKIRNQPEKWKDLQYGWPAGTRYNGNAEYLYTSWICKRRSFFYE